MDTPRATSPAAATRAAAASSATSAAAAFAAFIACFCLAAGGGALAADWPRQDAARVVAASPIPAPGGELAHAVTDRPLGAPATRIDHAAVGAPTRDGAAPIAIPDGYLVQAGETLYAAPGNGVLVNDVDPEGDDIFAIAYTSPAHGEASMWTSGAFSYTPDAGYTGVDTIEYRISDGTTPSDFATVTINVLPAASRAPIATDDHYSVPAGEELEVGATAGLLRNDLDLDDDAIWIVSIQAPSHGTINIATDGSFAYTPDPGFQGAESLVYTLTDGSATAQATLVLNVLEPANRRPVTQTDWYYTPTSTALPVSAAEGILRNDLDPDGDAISVQSIQAPGHGTINIATDGSFTYTPDPSWEGIEALVYTVADANGATNAEPRELRLLVGVYGDIPSGVLTPPRPGGFALQAPAPNPFNPRTELAFRTEQPGHVALRILDLRGRVVATLLDAPRSAGEHTVIWEGRDDRGGRVASGTYVAELRQGADRAVQKLTVVK